MKSRRTLAIRPTGSQSSEINVTPLVDVVLVLLIIFMVVTPLLEKDIGVRVPATEQVQSASEVPQSQLVVQIATNGDLQINDRPVDDANYVQKLSEILEQRFDKTVFVVPEDGANYGRMVHVLDGAKQAGATVLGVATEITPK
jgi:biopolymer transport protein TolR